jgi:fructoselysine-6-P-deglycase FrlB-like protein
MDAGLAAVLGALAGALATTGAAFVTGWSAREQATLAARAEHKRQRRAPREEAYKAFLSEAMALMELLRVVRSYEALPDAVRGRLMTPGTRTQAEEIEARIKERWLEVTLAGPESVQEPAAAIEDASSQLVGMAAVIIQLHWEEEEERAHYAHASTYFDRLDRAVKDFTQRAQAVLDDDGSE